MQIYRELCDALSDNVMQCEDPTLRISHLGVRLRSKDYFLEKRSILDRTTHFFRKTQELCNDQVFSPKP